MTRTSMFSTGLALGLAALALVTSVRTPAESSRAPKDVHAVYMADFTDDRRLVGAVDNVFVGHVIAQVGTTPSEDVPETQFAVEVVETVKGTLRGKVIVNQEGGMQGDAPILFDHDPLLKSGATYLFATRLYKETGWQTLVPNYGDLQVKDAQHQEALIERFKKATQQQITPYPVPSKD